MGGPGLAFGMVWPCFRGSLDFSDSGIRVLLLFTWMIAVGTCGGKASRCRFRFGPSALSNRYPLRQA